MLSRTYLPGAIPLLRCLIPPSHPLLSALLPMPRSSSSRAAAASTPVPAPMATGSTRRSRSGVRSMSTAAATPAAANAAEASPAAPARKRGRPPKSAAAAAVAPAPVEAMPVTVLAPRKRGRPAASSTAQAPVVQLAEAGEAAPAPAAAGRRGKRKATPAPLEAGVVEPTIAAPSISAEVADAVPSKRSKKGTSSKKAAAASLPASSSPSAAVPALLSFKHGTLPRDFELALLSERGLDCASSVLVGVDEAGRGPLAGPVVCAAVHVPWDVRVEGVHDSKKMSEVEREAVFAQLVSHPQVRYATAILEHTEIDQINILEATLRGMERAVAGCVAKMATVAPTPLAPSLILVDGNRMPPHLPQGVAATTVVKGDSHSYAIAAASIIAKVTRDRLMLSHHASWPQYNFAQHKGYGVGAHMSAIYKYGPCPIHRMTFAPMKHMKPRSGDQAAAEKVAVAAETPAAAARRSRAAKRGQ